MINTFQKHNYIYLCIDVNGESVYNSALDDCRVATCTSLTQNTTTQIDIDTGPPRDQVSIQIHFGVVPVSPQADHTNNDLIVYLEQSSQHQSCGDFSMCQKTAMDRGVAIRRTSSKYLCNCFRGLCDKVHIIVPQDGYPQICEIDMQ